MWEPLPEHYEQSSDDIWDAVCVHARRARGRGRGADDVAAAGSTRRARSSASTARARRSASTRLRPATTRATSSCGSTTARRRRPRASTRRATRGCARWRRGLARDGDPEAALPREALPAAWARRDGREGADLADFLVHRARRRRVRRCAVVCKWNYHADAGDGAGLGWDRDFPRGCGFADGELGPHTVGATRAGRARRRRRRREAARAPGSRPARRSRSADRRARGRRRRARRGRAAAARGARRPRRPRQRAAAAAGAAGALEARLALIAGASTRARAALGDEAGPSLPQAGRVPHGEPTAVFAPGVWGPTTAPCSGPVPQRGRAAARGQAARPPDRHAPRARRSREASAAASAAPRRSTRARGARARRARPTSRCSRPTCT